MMLKHTFLAAITTLILFLMATNLLFSLHIVDDGTIRHGLPLFESLPEPLSKKQKEEEAHFHVVFSTGCSPYQDWQSYAFFYHAWKSGQSQYGKVTRVASGCDAETAKALIATHEREIRPLSENFLLHLTPEYSKILPGTTYKFFNKPYGLRHWMEHGLGFSGARNMSSHSEENTVFVILDPDMIILRPFSSRNMEEFESWVTPGPRVVCHGQPFGQLYEFYAVFKPKIDNNLMHILNSIEGYDESKEKSHLYKWTAQEIHHHYCAGPPYIATGRDMYQIVKMWADVAIPVLQLTQNMLSEMFAYSVAAGHLKLQHELSYSFMVSNANARIEGFNLAENWTNQQVCAVDNPPGPLPFVLHYCQPYYLGPYFFSKYRLTEEILSCHGPLLAEPPESIGDQFNFSVTTQGVVKDLDSKTQKRMALMLCHVIARLNEAAEHWKRQFCDPTTTNFDRTAFLPFRELSS